MTTPMRRLLWLVLPIAFVALFCRELYTPDEPREAAMALTMLHQANKSLPTLGAEPFAEKPPLLYWLGAATAAVGGDSAAAIRGANLLYLLLTALAIAALVRPVTTNDGVFAAGFVAVTAYILYRTQIWFATDAPLVTGVAIALLGMQRVFTSSSATRRALGYGVLHLGLLICFFAKGPAGWLVPGCAFLTVVVLERRWREILSRELWLGGAVIAAIVGAWLAWVANSPGGEQSLRVLLWYNLLGRFVKLEAADHLVYATGHQNTPVEYFFSLPIFTLPWTPLVIAALWKAPEALRKIGATATTWRIGVGAIVLPLILLAVSATGRDVYYGPVALGFAILVGLWVGSLRSLDERHTNDRSAQRAWIATRIFVGIFASICGSVALLATLAPAFRNFESTLLAVVAGVGLVGALWLVMRRTADNRPLQNLALSVTVCLTLVIGPLYHSLDRWLSLPSLAERVLAFTGTEALDVYEPDETITAVASLYIPTASSSTITTPGNRRILWLVPDRSRWKAKSWFSYLGYRSAPRDPAPPVNLPAALQNWALECVLERPGGRRVAIVAPPGAAPLKGVCR